MFPVGEPVALQVALLVDVHLGTDATLHTGFYMIQQESHHLQAIQIPYFRAPSNHGTNAHNNQLANSHSTHLESICIECLHKYIFMFYYPPPHPSTTPPLLTTDQARQYSSHIYIRGYYRVLSYNNNNKKCA